WVLNGGPDGANGPLLKANEFDGYLTISGGGDEIHMPWHVLPHKASNVLAPTSVKLRHGSASATLFNIATGGQVGVGEVFALTGTSPQIPPDQIPGVGTDQAVVDLRSVGVRYFPEDDVLQFGINTFGERAHPNAPAEFDVVIDTDRDGTDDYVVFNRDLSLEVSDGRNVVFVLEIATGALDAFFFTDANLNSANAILTVPAEVLGLADGDQFDFTIQGVDWYFTGDVTDSIEDMTFTLGTPRYATEPTVEVPFGFGRIDITAVDGGADASPSQTGVLVLWRDGLPGKEAATIRVQ
ncbi:MAG TPA: hypothetical protein VIL37_08710, partial [Natronosporangium sp.]